MKPFILVRDASVNLPEALTAAFLPGRRCMEPLLGRIADPHFSLKNRKKPAVANMAGMGGILVGWQEHFCRKTRNLPPDRHDSNLPPRTENYIAAALVKCRRRERSGSHLKFAPKLAFSFLLTNTTTYET